MEDTTDAVLITYLDGRALYINQSFGRFLGFTNLTKSSIDIYSLHGKKLVDHILDCASQGFPCDQEVYLTNLNGVECPFQLRCSPIEDDSFEPQGVCWIYTNISEQKKVEQKKMEREKLEGVVEMGGAACHELNQPLQAVLGQAELLLLSIPKENPHYEKVKIIVENATKMAGIIQKMQRITRYKTVPYSDQKIIDIDSASTL